MENIIHPCKIFVDSQCDCIGECGNDNARIWQKQAQLVSYEYAGDYIAGVEDFKLALKAKIQEEIDHCKGLLDAGFADVMAEERCIAKYEFCNSLLNKTLDKITPIEE